MKFHDQDIKKLKAFHADESRLLSSDPSNYSYISKPRFRDSLKTIRQLRWGSREIELSKLKTTLYEPTISTHIANRLAHEPSQFTPPVSSGTHILSVESFKSQSLPLAVNSSDSKFQEDKFSFPLQLSRKTDFPEPSPLSPLKSRVENRLHVDLESYKQLKTAVFKMYNNSEAESISYEDKCKLMALAASHGDLQTMQFMIEKCNTHPGIKNNIAIIEAAKAGKFQVVDYLMKNPKVNPVDQKHYAMKMSVQQGHLQVLKRLLEYPKMDPSFDNNYAIRTASINGFTEIVQHLLLDRRVDPTVKDFYAIRHAAKNGHMDIVQILLADPSVKKPRVMIAANRNKKAFANLIWILKKEIYH